MDIGGGEIAAIASGSSGVTFIANWAVSKYRLSRVEKDLDDGLAAVRIAKNSRIKEIKEDYKERAQVLHDRVDNLRNEQNKKFDDLRKEQLTHNQAIEKKITDGFSALNKRLDGFIQSQNK